MKLSLVVHEGKSAGKVIPVTLSQFLIGRDQQCHLRPASPMISKRHCALLVRAGKAFIRDLNSTNGTFLNDRQVRGEIELANGDRLKIGPLVFDLKLETTAGTGLTPVDKPTPMPPAKGSAEGGEDESIAAMLLELQDEGSAGPPPQVPGTTTTITELPREPAMDQTMPLTKLNEDEVNAMKTEKAEKAAKADKSKPAPTYADTSVAAKALLDKYTRRPRK